MQCIIKKIVLCIITFLLIPHIYGHGFALHTLVQLEDGSQKTIYAIYLKALRCRVSVATYDVTISQASYQNVKIGKPSISNDYIKLGFGSLNNDTDEIFCTPMQEFYVQAIQEWVPAYKLFVGDELLTKNMGTKPIIYKEYVPSALKICALEIKNTHTFFVGKHSILTHNIPLPALILGAFTSFDTAALATGGSFFGPIGFTAGFVVGGIAIAGKAIYHHHKEKTLQYSINSSENHYSSLSNNEEINPRPTGCFTESVPTQTLHIDPIQDFLSEQPIGCIEIKIQTPIGAVTNKCFEEPEFEKKNGDGCFSQPEKNEVLCNHYRNNTSTETPKARNKKRTKTSKVQNQKPTETSKVRKEKPEARNWDEFEKNCPIGQKYGKKFIHTGKQNPKDKSPIQKLSEDIPNTEMFKKGRYFALDRYHDGDHCEVWDKNGNWIGVANLDGSENYEKSNAEKDVQKRNIKKIL